MRCLWTFAIAFALLTPAGAADTIVLKNGRCIRAEYVVVEGDRVRFETPAGWMSLPLSLVARIEVGPAGNDFGPPVAPFSAPALESSIPADDVAAATLRDGSVNREWLAQLELQARSAEPLAVARVVAAHHAAAQFFLRRGELEPAMAHYRRALHFAPDEPVVLIHLAYLHLRRSEFTAALDSLDRARRRVPDSPEVAKLAGWAYYGSNRLEPAVAEWRRALALRPDPEVATALEKAERDLEVESRFRGGQSRHFTLRYDGNARPELAHAILRVLEEHFAALAAALNYTPPEPIGVVLYTDRSFADLTRAPAWAGAVNDGRLRVPVQGLSQVTPELARVLRHELAHSFLAQKTGGRCPVWLHEGVAQWLEGQRSREARATLLAAVQRHGPLPLAALESSWTELPAETASLAYTWSLAVVEFLIETHGLRDLERLLDRIAASATAEQAVREILRADYAELEQQTVRFLSRR
jgi:hypothetical protein